MWSKVIKSPTFFFVLGTVVGISLFSIFQNSDERFVKSFKRLEAPASIEPTENVKSKAVLTLLQSLEPQAKKFTWFSSLDEYILIKVVDADDARYSIRIKDGTVTIRPGWIRDEKTTLVLESIKTAHLKRLSQILSDQKLEESEMFEIASVFMVPGLQALYNADVLYFPGDKRFLKLDNIIQVELTNKYGVKDLEGNPLVAKATVVNADGYFLVFDGWQGSPDVIYTVDVNQMLQYYYVINYKFKELKPSDLMARKEILDEYMKLRDETLTYSSHQN